MTDQISPPVENQKDALRAVQRQAARATVRSGELPTPKVKGHVLAVLEDADSKLYWASDWPRFHA